MTMTEPKRHQSRKRAAQRVNGNAIREWLADLAEKRAKAKAEKQAVERADRRPEWLRSVSQPTTRPLVQVPPSARHRRHYRGATQPSMAQRRKAPARLYTHLAIKQDDGTKTVVEVTP